jgi:4-amino-4-deoxy-L-arabinose transferase-like glycosyltransferase
LAFANEQSCPALETHLLAIRDEEDRMAQAMARWLLFGSLMACSAAAFALRIYGVNFGLPYLYYWDEPTVMNRAVRFGSGDFNPHFFYYPALYMYVLFVVSGLYFAAGRLTGHLHSAQDFAAEYFITPTGVYTAARAATALIGAAASVVTYSVGKRFFDARTGLLGALFLAISVLHATHSHIAITDVPQSFFIVAAYIPIYGVFRSGRRRDYLLAGLLIGLGAATKYLAILLLPTLLLAHFRREDEDDTEQARFPQRALSPDLALALAGVFAGFFLGTPYNVLNFRDFLADYRQQMALSQGAGGNSVGYFLGNVLPGDFGWPLLFTAFAGFVLLLIQRRRASWIFVSFPVLYFLFMARYPRGFARYMIPEDPFLALMAGYALSRAWEPCVRKFGQPVARAGGAVVLCLLVAAPLTTNLRWDRLMAQETDPRTEALRWTEQNIPAGRVVAVQSLFDRAFFNAPLITDERLNRLDREMPHGGKFDAVRGQVFAALKSRPVYRETPFVEDYETLRRAGAQYLFVSDANGPLTPAFRQELNTRAKVVFHSAPPPLTAGIPDAVAVLPPTITVFTLPENLAPR